MVKRNDTVNPNEEISNLNVTGYTCGHVLGTDCFFELIFPGYVSLSKYL